MARTTPWSGRTRSTPPMSSPRCAPFTPYGRSTAFLRWCAPAPRVWPRPEGRSWRSSTPRGSGSPGAWDQARSAANGASASSATDVPARPLRACSASANSTRPSTLSARCRAWTSSRWATNGAGVHHHIEFSGVLDRRLDRSVARMGITPTTGCPGPRAPNDPPWGPQASLNSRALVLPWRRTLSGCEYLAAWP